MDPKKGSAPKAPTQEELEQQAKKEGREREINEREEREQYIMEQTARELDARYGKKFIWAIWILYGFLAFYSLVLYVVNYEVILMPEVSWSPGNMVLCILGILLLFSVYIIEQGEIGVHIVAGRIYEPLFPGIYFKIPFLSEKRMFPSLLQKEDYPGRKIWKGKDEDMPKNEGWVLPMRATTAADLNVDGDPLNNRMTVEPRVFAQYKVVDPIAFYKEMGGDMEELKDQIGSAVVAQVKVEYARHTMAFILSKLDAINRALVETAQKVVKKRGVEIVDMKIEETDLGRTVNLALLRVPDAQSKGKATADEMKLVTEAKVDNITKEGLANAEVTKQTIEAKLEAEAKGLAEKMKLLGVSGADVLYAEMAESMTAGTDSIIMAGAGDGLKDILAAGKTLQAALGAGKKKENGEKLELILPPDTQKTSRR